MLTTADTTSSRARTIIRSTGAALAILGAIALVALAAPGGARAAEPPSVALTAGPFTLLPGQAITLTARARNLPPRASIVIVGVRNGRTFVVRACARGVAVCTRRVSAGTGQTVRFRAVIRHRGRVVRRSRVITATWRVPTPIPPPAPAPAPPPARAVLRLIAVIPDGFPFPGCQPGSVPAGGGSQTVQLTSTAGDAKFDWTLPGEIVQGPNSAAITVTASPNAQSGSLSSYTMRINFSAATAITPPNSPVEFSTNSTQPLGASYTFTPSSGSFAEGAPDSEIQIRTSGCGSLRYIYRRVAV